MFICCFIFLPAARIKNVAVDAGCKINLLNDDLSGYGINPDDKMVSGASILIIKPAGVQYAPVFYSERKTSIVYR